MLIEEVSDIEKFINSLNEENKVSMTANINFLITNYLSQQKNLDIYSFMDKFATLLNTDNQQKLVEYLTDLVEYFNQKHRIEVNSKPPTATIEENPISISAMPINPTITSPSQNIPAGDPNSLIEKMRNKAASLLNELNDLAKDSSMTPSITSQPEQVNQTNNGNGSSNSNKPNIPSIEEAFSNLSTDNLPQQKQEVQTPKVETPPPPVEKPKIASTPNNVYDTPYMPIINGLVYLKPSITDKAKEDVMNMAIEPQTYSTLRLFNGEHDLNELYTNNHSKLSLFDFLITLVIPFHAKGYLSFHRVDNVPEILHTKLKIGEVLVSLNIIDQKKLNEIINKQKENNQPKKKSKSLSSMMYDITEVENAEPSKPKKMIGELVVEQNIITRQQLEQVLIIQKWYNHVVAK